MTTICLQLEYLTIAFNFKTSFGQWSVKLRGIDVLSGTEPLR